MMTMMMMMVMMTTTTLSGKKGNTTRLFKYTPKSTDRPRVCTFTHRDIIQCVPLATEPGISLIILTPIKILQ